MIYVTGDTHGDFSRFNSSILKATKKDYIIICGDFGGVWFNDNKDQEMVLDNLDKMIPATILFVTGNHDNYDKLKEYPISWWNNGKVQFIRPTVIHLMRGQVFNIEGKTFFTFGGAACHDIMNGVLDKTSPDYKDKKAELDSRYAFYRVNHESWWKEELPTSEEMEEGIKNLEKYNWKVDYVITHCVSDTVQDYIVKKWISIADNYEHNCLTNYFENIMKKLQFKHWCFGHYHNNYSFDIDGCSGSFHLFYHRWDDINDLD